MQKTLLFMLNTGIVGQQNSKLYIDSIKNHPAYNLVGVFDPSFQFDIPKELPENEIFTSFGILLNRSQVIIFASPDNTYFPLIELAIKSGKPVFLHSTYYLNREELLQLINIKEEACGIVQIYHPFLMHDAFLEFGKLCKTPLLVDCKNVGLKEKNLVPILRQQVTGIFTLYSKNVKKVSANTISSFSEVPDIINLRIDFDNGSIVNILVNSIEKETQHNFKFFEYNSHYSIDITSCKLTCSDANNDFHIKLSKNSNVPEMIIRKQLTNFFQHIINHTYPTSCLENEYNAFRVMEKVKEKMRACINIF